MALRLWNPFKPHVAKLTSAELFVVRKLELGGWVYKGIDGNYWWFNKINVVKYCIHFSPESAAQAALTKKKPFARLYAY